MLRALFVIGAILVGIRYSAKGPFYALLFYLWIAHFRPESWLWWDFFSSLNLSFLVGIVVVGSALFSNERLRMSGTTTMMLALAAQSLVSVLFSTHFDYAFTYWQDFAKSTLISVMIVLLVNTEQRLRLTVLVIALSLGLEGAKQGWAQLILNPGGANHNIHSSIGDNNAVAVGMLMLVALFVGLGRTAPKRWEKVLHRFMAVGVVYRAISTYSRGGFLSAAAMALFFVLRSKRRLGAIVGLAIVVALLVPALPDAFWDRMNTIPTGTEEMEDMDSSSAGRVHFWEVGVVMANANPFTGVGHMAYNLAYDDYDFLNGAYGRGRSVHSTWFAVLSELGYPGFILFIAILIIAYRACRRAQKLAKSRDDLKALGALGNAFEMSLVPFAVGGTFVIFQYTEILWHILALSIALERIVTQRVAVAAEAPQSRVVPVAVPAPAVRVTVPARAGMAPLHRVRS